nr:hypothetical protein [Rhodococcus sp. (in: high G+C Gram-positive bacteria)]
MDDVTGSDSHGTSNGATATGGNQDLSVRPPRILPAHEDELSAENVARIKASVANGVPGIRPDNAFWTLGRHERLFKGYCAFAVRLFNGMVPLRDREILILRTAIVCQSDYEWGQHRVTAEHLEVMTSEEIARTVEPEWDGWTRHERSLMDAVDELHADSRLKDATWESLSATYDDAQMVELLMVIGFYHMLAYTVNTVEIAMEGAAEPVPPRAAEA